jgi:RNA polymerase sigma factor (sigma-70 family)
MSTDSIPDLVRRAGAGDQAAWRDLVAACGPRIWAVTRAYRLDGADAADVFQTTWLNLAERFSDLRDPARVSAWLVTTAKRECLRVIALRRRLPARWTDEEPPLGPEDHVVLDARDKELWQAFRGLSPRCQRLLRLVAYMPEFTYAQLAKAIGIGEGSVGQTKGRCLRTLRLRLGPR